MILRLKELHSCFGAWRRRRNANKLDGNVQMWTRNGYRTEREKLTIAIKSSERAEACAGVAVGGDAASSSVTVAVAIAAAADIVDMDITDY